MKLRTARKIFRKACMTKLIAAIKPGIMFCDDRSVCRACRMNRGCAYTAAQLKTAYRRLQRHYNRKPQLHTYTITDLEEIW